LGPQAACLAPTSCRWWDESTNARTIADGFVLGGCPWIQCCLCRELAHTQASSCEYPTTATEDVFNLFTRLYLKRRIQYSISRYLRTTCGRERGVSDVMSWTCPSIILMIGHLRSGLGSAANLPDPSQTVTLHRCNICFATAARTTGTQI
jgi:hypothetical protein